MITQKIILHNHQWDNLHSKKYIYEEEIKENEMNKQGTGTGTKNKQTNKLRGP
jgi:hypothetical protein